MPADAPRRVRVDMHQHSDRSPDSRMPAREQARLARAVGLDVVCATDHDTIAGGLRLREVADGLRVVVGAEIRSRDGEIVGLFLERDVPRGLSAEETVERIHAQGGLAIVPHPFSRNRGHHLRREALDRIRAGIDAIEVFNARELLASDNARAAAYARTHGIAGAVGSDAHRSGEVGAAWIELDDFADRDGFAAALRGGTVHGRLSGPLVHVGTRWDSARNWLDRRIGRRSAG